MVTRKRILVGLVAFLLVGLVVWMVSLRPKDSLAGLVPDHASWYLEVVKPIEVLKGVQKGIRLFSDPGLTLFSEWQEELLQAEDLFKREPEIYNFIRNSTLGISAHAITGKEAGYLFYISLPHSKHARVLELLRKEYGNNRDFRFENREYLGKTIAEVSFKKTGSVFSLASSDDALIGSFSGFLVEEVVRRSGILFKPNFASRLRRDSRYAAFSGKPIRLFLQLRNAPDFLFHYLSRNLQGLNLTGNLGEALLLGFESPDGLNWKSEGYLLNEELREKSRHPLPLDPSLPNFLPDPEVLFFQYSMKNLWNGFPGKKEGQEGLHEILETALADEMALGLTEGEGLKKYNRILVARVKNQAALDQFLQAAGNVKIGTDLYKEKFNEYLICQHSNPGLSAILGGAVLSDWVPSFFARVGDFILFSDDVETIKRSIDKFSVLTKKENQGTPSHHFSFRMSPSRCVPLLMESAGGPFKKNFSEWVPLLKSMEEIRISDLGEEENPSVSLVIRLKLSGSISSSPTEIKRIFLDSLVTTSPYRLESGYSDQVFWVVQDLKKQAHLIGSDLTEIFRAPLPERWNSKPQILETRNSKDFSILFSMPHALRILDHKGNPRPGFPVLMPDSQSTMEHVRLIDYDKSLQYRIFIAGRYGPVYAADMEGRFLDGWKPWNHPNPLVSAPRHIRIGEKDFILMLDNSGTLLLTNRKGEIQSGFPYSLTGRTNQPLFVEPGLGIRNSYIYCLSELGQMEKISLEGKPASSIQLFRPEKETRFQLCPDQKQKTFSVARITGNLVTIFDQGYRPVFDFQAKSSQVLVQHFQFGASNKIYAVLDLEARECNLFNETGSRITQTPLEASQPIDVLQKPDSDSEFLILTVFENRLSLSGFSKN